MRVAIVGAGGVGGYVGARLQAQGNDVHFIARGSNLQALRSAGLTVHSPLGDLRLPQVAATNDPASVGPVDLVVLGVKLHGLEAAAATLRPLLGPDTAVLPVQNGVDAADRLIAVLGPQHVLKGSVYIVSFLKSLGVVDHKSPFCRLVFAEADGAASPRTQRLAELLRAAGIEASVSPDIDADLWRKFLMLAPFAAVACLTRGTAGQVLGHASTRALLRDAMAEVAAVAAAKGIRLPADIIDASLEGMKRFPADARPSMQLDIDAGRPLELESLSGTVVRLGAACGVPTPVHDVAYRALSLYAVPEGGGRTP